MGNFVTFDNMKTIMTNVGQKFKTVTGAYIPKGNSTFAALPVSLDSTMSGFTYNITEDFVTDTRFIEGSGKKYPQGTNVIVIDLSTYAEVASPEGNPSTSDYYEINSGKYVTSADTEVKAGKTYYTRTENMKLDVLSGFVDLSGVEAMISGTFNTELPYNTGDVVIYDGQLYKFTSDHAAGAWVAAEAAPTNLASLLEAQEPAELTTTQMNTLLGLL